MRLQTCVRVIAMLLILLFMYTAVSKLMDYEGFHRQLSNQNIPDWSVPILSWLIPLSEVLLAVGLLFSESRYVALWGSALLMFFFTGYMAMIVFHFSDRVPCSCGGVLKRMGFTAHLLFNLFFLLLSVSAICIEHKIRAASGHRII